MKAAKGCLLYITHTGSGEKSEDIDTIYNKISEHTNTEDTIISNKVAMLGYLIQDPQR